MTAERAIETTRAAIVALGRVIHALERKDDREAALGFQRAHALLRQAAREHCSIEVTP